MGLIPNEQARFVQGIKTIISKHKQNQLTFKVKYYLLEIFFMEFECAIFLSLALKTLKD